MNDQVTLLDDEIEAKKSRYQGTLQEYKDFSKKMGLPMQKERIYQDGLKVKMEPKNEPKPEPEPKLKPKPGTANAKSSKVVEKEPKPDKIEVPDITRCLYRTESEYKALVKTHSKNTDKVDKKLIKSR